MRNRVRLRVERLDMRTMPSVSPIDQGDVLPPDTQSPVADIIATPPPPVATGAFLPPGLAPSPDGDLNNSPPTVVNGAFLPPVLVRSLQVIKAIPMDGGVFVAPGKALTVTG